MNEGKNDLEPDPQAAHSSYVELVRFIEGLPGIRSAAFPSYFPPMLASLAENAFSKPGWIYEPKMDGMRCIAFIDGNKVKLLSRRGKNITAQYPALVASLPGLCKCKVVLDGEIIALNADGKPSFQLLQQRMNLLNVSDISRADARIPVHFFVFDIVYAAEFSLASTSLVNRKTVLQKCLAVSSNIVILRHFEENGKIAYDACIEHGFEGIVAKRKESPYETGRRSPYWVKVKGTKTSEFVIAGYSMGQGSRSNTFGSLVLGYHDSQGQLVYAGSVGSGFDERLLADMLRRMDPLKIKACPIMGIPSDKRDSTWVKPELVAEIKFMDWTDDMHLRNPVFLHLRHDINPAEVKVVKAIDPAELDNVAGRSEFGKMSLELDSASRADFENGAVCPGLNTESESFARVDPVVSVDGGEGTNRNRAHLFVTENTAERLEDESPVQQSGGDDSSRVLFDAQVEANLVSSVPSCGDVGSESRLTDRHTDASAEMDPSGAEMDPSGAGKDPSGAGRDPSGAGKDPSGAEMGPRGVGMDPNGAATDPRGAEMDPSGAEMDPSSAEMDPSGVHDSGKFSVTALSAAADLNSVVAPDNVLVLEKTIVDIEREFPLWQKLSQSVIGQLSGKEKSYSLTVEQATISLTNLDKVLYPSTDDHPAITKRDYLKTIALLAPYMLTHLYDRPLTMIRAPSGVRSRSFYQKHWNLDIPDYLENIRTEPDDPTRRDQLLCNSVAGLIFLAQNNILEYHCWLSRVPHLASRGAELSDLSLLEIPDFMAFDIDIHRDGEKESKQLDLDLFEKARDAAFKLKETLDQLGLPSFLKTSGRNGLHVFIPIIRDLRFDEVRVLSEMIAKHVESRYTQTISTSAVAAKRASKVFLDYQANTRGKTITLPYSPRLTTNATISMPISWAELERVYPGDFNQRVIRDLLGVRGDIWRDILRNPDDLAKRFHTKR